MSLQNYDFTLPIGKTFPISAPGKYVYYYAGTTPNITAGTVLTTAGNQAIRITAANGGATVQLMPGQSFRLGDDDKAPSEWKITNVAGLEQITGSLLMGDGEFTDSNTSNTVKIDGTFANNVTVMNTTASRVPTTADLTQTIPVSIAGTINTSGSTVAYTHSYTSNAASAVNTAISLLAAATNVNGAYLQKFELIMNAAANGAGVVIAKATAPANITDGDVLFSGVINPTVGNRMSLDVSKDGQVQVAAGKGIWYISSQIDGALLRDALFRVL